MGLALTILLYQIGHPVYPATWSFYTMEKFSWSEAEVGYSLEFVGLLMANEMPQNEQGELQGMIASLGSVGAIIGPLLMT